MDENNQPNSVEITQDEQKANQALFYEKKKVTSSYVLTRDEVTCALMIAGKLKDRKKRTIVETVICAILFIVALCSTISDPSYFVGYVTMAAMAIVIAVVLLWPKHEEKKIIDNALKTSSTETVMTLKADKIHIHIPKSGVSWDIIPEMVRGIRSNENIYVIFLKDSRIVVIPKRVLDDDIKQKAFEITKQALTEPKL